jgi:hypothetical protein
LGVSHPFDSERLWKASLPEQDRNVLADKLDMQSIPAEQVGDAYRRTPPEIGARAHEIIKP